MGELSGGGDEQIILLHHHLGGEALHERICSFFKITQHGVALPSGDQYYHTRVHFDDKERHGSFHFA